MRTHASSKMSLARPSLTWMKFVTAVVPMSFNLTIDQCIRLAIEQLALMRPGGRKLELRRVSHEAKGICLLKIDYFVCMFVRESRYLLVHMLS